MGGKALSAVAVAALTAGALILPVPAQAAQIAAARTPADQIAAARIAAAQMAIPSAPCRAGGVTAADDAIAARLRPSMTGRRLGRSVDGYNISCARAIVARVVQRGLHPRAAVIAISTAITESTLHNYTIAVDHDSLGLFQQRPSMGWGQPNQIIDPGFATNSFLNKMLRKHPGNTWMTGDIGEISQRVQVSAYPAAYATETADAERIVEMLWKRPDRSAPLTPATPGSARPTADGPFQEVLLDAATGQGPTDARYQLSVADWNVDRRPDLVVVQQSGSAGGGTEVHILSGVSGFRNSLLLTGTVLGPTDARSTFSVADWNADGRPDLVVTQRSGTASGKVEVRVMDGASNLQRYLAQTVTALGAIDDHHAVSVADFDADGHPDVIITQKSGTASGKTEVRVLDGASDLQRYLVETVTALGPLDARHDILVADWNRDRRPDLVVVQKSGTKSGRTEVRVLDGASKFRRTLLRKSTAQGPTDDRHSLSVVDWNSDGKLDLAVLQKSGAASSWTQARILAG